MKKAFILLVVLLSFSSEVFPQLRKSAPSFIVETGVIILPSVEGNGALEKGGISNLTSIGMEYRFDALKIAGEIGYIPANEKLFSAGGRILFELPFRKNATNLPIFAGFGYRLFISEWEVHSVSANLQYFPLKNIYIRAEGGFITYSLREDRKATGFVSLQLGYSINWRY